MTEPATVLVTGATGKLGTAACNELLARGYAVRATDRRFVRDFPIRVEIGDLCDEGLAYRLLEGVDAVLHLGNYPNVAAGPSPQRVLSDNTAMNSNVFLAAVDLGVRCVAFASSVQVTAARDRLHPGPIFPIPYLPLDGALPRNPGLNCYAQSKEFAERMLELLVEADPELSATAIRFPMLCGEWWVRRQAVARSTPLGWLDFAECTAHLFFEDAARLLADVVARRLPGYHQYFPAQSMLLDGYSVQELVAEHYPRAELRRPLAELTNLIDVSRITAELGWVPTQRLSFVVDR